VIINILLVKSTINDPYLSNLDGWFIAHPPSINSLTLIFILLLQIWLELGEVLLTLVFNSLFGFKTHLEGLAKTPNILVGINIVLLAIELGCLLDLPSCPVAD
jgi:hypothetical protein